MLALGINLHFSSYVRLLFAAIVQPFLICVVVLGTPVRIKGVKKIFENERFSYLGRMSYSVYLGQQLATAWYPSLPSRSTIFFLLAVRVFAHYSYKYFEGPLIRLGMRYTNGIKSRTLLPITT